MLCSSRKRKRAESPEEILLTMEEFGVSNHPAYVCMLSNDTTTTSTSSSKGRYGEKIIIRIIPRVKEWMSMIRGLNRVLFLSSRGCLDEEETEWHGIMIIVSSDHHHPSANIVSLEYMDTQSSQLSTCVKTLFLSSLAFVPKVCRHGYLWLCSLQDRDHLLFLVTSSAAKGCRRLLARIWKEKTSSLVMQ